VGYNIDFSKVFQPLLDAVNSVKLGSDINLTLKYSYDEASLTDIKSKSLSAAHFKVDIENSLFQWQSFISDIYSNKRNFKGNLNLKFENTTEVDADIVFAFSSISSNTSISGKTILFNSNLDWGSSLVPGKYYVTTNCIYIIGLFLGLNSKTGRTPMNHLKLKDSFTLINGLVVDENGLTTKAVLHNSKSLTKQFKQVYGGVNNSIARVYGCTNPNASNYNPKANTNDGSCINVPNIVVPSPSYSRFISRKIKNTTANNSIISLSHNSDYQTYGSLSIETFDSTYTSPDSLTDEGDVTKNIVVYLEGEIRNTITIYGNVDNIASDQPWSYIAVYDRIGNLLSFGDGMPYLIKDHELSFNIDSYKLTKRGDDLILCVYLYGKTSSYFELNLDATDAVSTIGIDCANVDSEFGAIQNLSNNENFLGSVFNYSTPQSSDLALYCDKVFNFSAGVDSLRTSSSDFFQAGINSNNTYVNSQSFGGTSSFISSGVFDSSSPELIANSLTDFEFYPEVKTITISPFQDSYIVTREIPNSTFSNLMHGVLGDSSGSYNDSVNKFFVNNDNGTLVASIVYPFEGFSFSGEDKTESSGLYRLSAKKWKLSSKAFTGENDNTTFYSITRPIHVAGSGNPAPLETSVFRYTYFTTPTNIIAGGLDDSLKNSDITLDDSFHKLAKYKTLISKRLRQGITSVGNTSGIGFTPGELSNTFTQFDLPVNLQATEKTNSGVGYKLMLISVEYGMILTYIDNLNGKLLGPNTPNTLGLEIQLPAGDNNLLEYNDGSFDEGGFKMIDVAFSPMDNFIYAIVENPETADRHIVVYDITILDQDSILNNAVSASNPFTGELSSVSLGADDRIYFYSFNSSEYLRVDAPDLQSSVDALILNPNLFISTLADNTITTTPSKEIHNILKRDSNGNLISFENASGITDSMEFFNAEWDDLSVARQLNVLPAIPAVTEEVIDPDVGVGEGEGGGTEPPVEPDPVTPTTHEFVEETVILGTTQSKENENVYNNYAILSSLPQEDLSSVNNIDIIDIGLSKTARIISATNNLLAIVYLQGSNLYVTKRDESSERISIIADDLISIELYSDATESYYNIIYREGLNIIKRKLRFIAEDGQEDYLPHDVSMGSIENPETIYTCLNQIINYTVVNDGSTLVQTTVYLLTKLITGVEIIRLLIENSSTEIGSVMTHTFDLGTKWNFNNTEFKYLFNSTTSLGEFYFNGLEKTQLEAIFKVAKRQGVFETSEIFISEILAAQISDPITVSSIAPVYTGEVLLSLAQKGETIGLYSLGTDKVFTQIQMLPELQNYPDDFEDGVYKANLDSTNVDKIVSLPNGNFYLTAKNGGYLSRIINPTSSTKYYAINIANDLNVDSSTEGPMQYIGLKEIGVVPTSIQEDPINPVVVVDPVEPDPDPVVDPEPPVEILGCTNVAACNYNSNATIDDNSCILPDPTLIDVCPNGGCFDNSIPYSSIDICGTCHIENDFEINTTCYKCPAGTDLGDGTFAEGCPDLDESPGFEGEERKMPQYCFEDFSACEIHGCLDESACNTVDLSAGGDTDPNTNLDSLCIFPEPNGGCVCADPGPGLVPSDVEEGYINCTNCNTYPYESVVFSNTYCTTCAQWDEHNSDTGLSFDNKHNIYTASFNPNTMQGACDCNGNLSGIGCDCNGTPLPGYCDCGIPDNTTSLPLCDCNGFVYDEDAQCPPTQADIDAGLTADYSCFEQQITHYWDGDGDGYYDPTISELKCPADVAANGPFVSGTTTPMWITIANAAGVDGCDGYQPTGEDATCNQDLCFSYNLDGSINWDSVGGLYAVYQELRISDPCGGCYFPSAGPTDYGECQCGEKPEGYCDCDGTQPEPGGNCVCGDQYNVVVTPPQEGNICQECSPEGQQPPTYDYCKICNGSHEYNASTGFITNTLTNEIKCNCDDDVVPSPCCPGFLFDGCLGQCVEAELISVKDCAGQCPSDEGYLGAYTGPGTGGEDACGICDGPFETIPDPESSTEGEECSCPPPTAVQYSGNIYSTHTPILADCAGNCGGTLVDDDCSVCGGDNSSCTGCMNTDAYNFDDTATIPCEDDNCCEFFELVNGNLYNTVNGEGDTANVEGVSPLHSDTELSSIIINNSVNATTPTIAQYIAPDNIYAVYIDNPLWTEKCQVISAVNPILILDNALENAEITYNYNLQFAGELTGLSSIEGLPNSGNSNTLGSIDVSTLSGKQVVFYFRFEGTLNSNILISDWIADYSNNIISVDKQDNPFVTNFQSGSEGLTIGVNGYADVSISISGLNGENIKTHNVVNYHVYRVVMQLDDDGTISELSNGIDFSGIFAPLAGADNTDIYVTAPCDTGFTNTNVFLSYTDAGLDADAIASLLANGTYVKVISAATSTVMSVTETYSLQDNVCVDDCLLDGNEYQSVCTNTEAINYQEVGECQVANNSICEYPAPIPPTPYCSDPTYVEYTEVDPEANVIADDINMCITPIEVEETEEETIQGTYNIITEFVGETPPDVEYIVYTKAGKVLQNQDGAVEVRTLSKGNVTRLIQTIRSADSCAGFLPIAFRNNEEWLRGNFRIEKNGAVLFELSFGEIGAAYNSSLDGSTIIKMGPVDCVAGCNDSTISNTGCTRIVPKDVKEFTDFTIEIMTEQSPLQSYAETSFILQDVVTGEKLINIESGIAANEVRIEEFRLRDTSTLGLTVTSPNMVVYRILDEQGTVIKQKTVYNESYFEPFTLELSVPGCTDVDAANYDSLAIIDDGSCIETSIYNCVKEALFEIDTLECDSRESNRNLQIYAVYQSYKESLKEKNNIKIEMYRNKLVDLCNCETC